MAKPTRKELIDDPISNYPLATVACFDPTKGDLPRRELDGELTKRFLEKLVEVGTESLLIAASTGHGHLRTIDELFEWFQFAAQAELGDTMLMALLRPEDGTEANSRLVESLAKSGYDVVFIRPGNDLAQNATAQKVAENMLPILNACGEVGLPAGVYSIPDVSGLALTADAISILLDSKFGENIVAIKITEADFENSTAKILADPRLARLKIVQGWDPHLALALQTGKERCGVTSGAMSLAIFQYFHILEAAQQNNWQEVQRAQESVSKLFASMQSDPTKFANLQIAKHVMGLGHPILDTIKNSDVEKLKAALRSIENAEDRQRLEKSLNLMK